MPKTLHAKCVIVGDSTVGKSALAQAFHSDGQSFPKTYTMTTGVEILVKSLNIPECNDSVELFIYDCAGKEVFFDFVNKNIDHPNMAIFVYDTTNEKSFSSCSLWLERLKKIKPEASFLGVLVATKVDLIQRRSISVKTGEDFASTHGLAYMECSAKEFQNVESPFQYLAKEYHTIYQEKVNQYKDML